MYTHSDYNKQQSGDRAGSSEAVYRQIHETYAAYITADLAFRQSLSATAAVRHVLDGNELAKIYELDIEATARLDDVIRLNRDQHPQNSSARFRRSISKKRKIMTLPQGLR